MAKKVIWKSWPWKIAVAAVAQQLGPRRIARARYRSCCWARRAQDARKATCNVIRLSLFEKHKNEGGMMGEGETDCFVFFRRSICCLKFMPKCIRRRFSPPTFFFFFFAHLHVDDALRKRRDSLSNQLIMVAHCPAAVAACRAACTLTGRSLLSQLRAEGRWLFFRPGSQKKWVFNMRNWHI